jgi:ABC-2 type transport system permease protein
MNTFPMLIRREFWENRSLWIAPLIWVGIIVVMVLWGVFVSLRHEDTNLVLDAQTVEEIRGMSDADREKMRGAIAFPEEGKQTAFAFSYLAIAWFISGFVSIVVFFYLIDCLYQERRDRSILFWKSMPVSDTQVVLSKLAVALGVVPVGVLLLAAATQLFLFIVLWLRFHGTVIGEIMPDWSFVSWFRAQVIALGVMAGGVMWYAPIAGYLLLVSVWARRNVFLWAVLPPVSLVALEGFFFHSTHVVQFIGRRFSGYITEMNLDSNAFKDQVGHERMPSIDDVFSALDLSGMFTSAEAWAGIAAAAAMVFVTIRIRRYRDDS